MELRTPYFEQHKAEGANFLPEGGWRLVSSYGDKVREVQSVIQGVGFIDFSSMGSYVMAGPEAKGVLQEVAVNDIEKLKPGKGLYTQICDDAGAVFDDVTVFMMRPRQYLVVTSTAGALKVQKLLKKYREERDFYLVDANFGILCFGGPKAKEFMTSLAPETRDLKFFESVIVEIPAENATVPCLIARAGISGELGYEVYSSAKFNEALWKVLMEKGKPFGLQPIGLQAILSLSLEKGYLAGKDFYPGASPIQLGLGWTIHFEKEKFIGKEALLKQRETGWETQLEGFAVEGSRDILKPDSDILRDGKIVGKLTSANYGYRVDRSLARGWIQIAEREEGGAYQVRDGEKEYTLRLVKVPFYDPENKAIMA
jgi:aminomethyltransferase